MPLIALMSQLALDWAILLRRTYATLRLRIPNHEFRITYPCVVWHKSCLTFLTSKPQSPHLCVLVMLIAC